MRRHGGGERPGRIPASIACALIPAALLGGCASAPENALFVYHDPTPRSTVIRKGRRPAPTVIIKTPDRGEQDVGALEVHTGSVGYWVDDDGDDWEQRLTEPVRRKRLRSLTFSKAVPIFTIPPEHFRLLIDRTRRAGLRRLPSHPSRLPPEDQAYYMLQIDRQPAEIYLKPIPGSLSRRVHAKELTLREAQEIADCWGRVKAELYNFGQYSLGSTGRR